MYTREFPVSCPLLTVLMTELIREKAADVMNNLGSRRISFLFANVVFYDGKKWMTPTQPLFCGIKRQILLEKGLIHEAEIKQKDLRQFKHTALINAMLDIGDTPFISMENILRPATLC